MEFINDNSTSTSSILFNHTVEDSLHLRDGNDTSVFDDHVSTDGASAAATSSNFATTCLFFVFPVIGFFAIVMGTCALRKRQLRQDAEAVRRHGERRSAADAERRLKDERRTRLVERALITTKVTFLPRRTGGGDDGKGGTGSRKGRSATMETMELSSASTNGYSSSDDLDSSMSSSCTALDAPTTTSARRASEASSSTGDDGVIDEERPNDCESLPASPPQPSSDDVHADTCAICLEPYREDDDVSYSRHQNCTHAFHRRCILMWLKDEYRNDCPCCRGPYLHLCVIEDDIGDYRLGSGDDSGDGSEDESSTATGTVTDIAQIVREPTSVAVVATTNDDAAIRGEDSNV